MIFGLKGLRFNSDTYLPWSGTIWHHMGPFEAIWDHQIATVKPSTRISNIKRLHHQFVILESKKYEQSEHIMLAPMVSSGRGGKSTGVTTLHIWETIAWQQLDFEQFSNDRTIS